MNIFESLFLHFNSNCIIYPGYLTFWNQCILHSDKSAVIIVMAVVMVKGTMMMTIGRFVTAVADL
jgi:hypothetical protein